MRHIAYNVERKGGNLDLRSKHAIDMFSDSQTNQRKQLRIPS
jgi:hypothetical protein